MAIQVEVPPFEVSDELRDYFLRLIQDINEELGAANNISVISQAPERPRSGRFYYLTQDLDDVLVEGFYIFINDAWFKLDATQLTPGTTP